MYNLKIFKKNLINKYFLSSLYFNYNELNLTGGQKDIAETTTGFQKKIKKKYLTKILKKFSFNTQLNSFWFNQESYNKTLNPLLFHKKFKSKHHIKFNNFFIQKQLYETISELPLFPFQTVNLFNTLYKIL